MEITSASFAGHESFPFRNTWLTKGVTHCAGDSGLFGRDEAMVVLGVGRNMVQSIRHWCLATRVLEEDPKVKNNRGHHLRPTEIGRRIFLGQDAQDAWDPYLEDIGTLWLIHWLLVTSVEKATTWYLAFNELHQPDFTRHTLEQAVGMLAERIRNARVTPSSLRRDVDVFIRSYVGSTVSTQAAEDSFDCPLAELGLIFEQPYHGLYAFARGPKDTLPDAALVFALWDYARRHSEQHTFTFDELAYEPLSPGRVFKLDESSLAERLERLAEVTGDAWQFSETAGFKQVVLAEPVDGMDILAEYYHARGASSCGAAQ